MTMMSKNNKLNLQNCQVSSGSASLCAHVIHFAAAATVLSIDVTVNTEKTRPKNHVRLRVKGGQTGLEQKWRQNEGNTPPESNALVSSMLPSFPRRISWVPRQSELLHCLG